MGVNHRKNSRCAIPRCVKLDSIPRRVGVPINDICVSCVYSRLDTVAIWCKIFTFFQNDIGMRVVRVTCVVRLDGEQVRASTRYIGSFFIHRLPAMIRDDVANYERVVVGLVERNTGAVCRIRNVCVITGIEDVIRLTNHVIRRDVSLSHRSIRCVC